MQRVRVSANQTPVQKLGQTQITLSPKFKLASNSPEPSSLIPNLPEDIALSCLLRTAVSTHVACRLVCRTWNAFFSDTGAFFTSRKQLSIPKTPFLFTFAFDRCRTKLNWLVLDLTSLTWFRLPPMPYDAAAAAAGGVCPHGFSCVPMSDSVLVCSGSLVLKYELLKHKWSVMPQMRTPRSFFASGAVDGAVYAAGGWSADRVELDTCEMYEPGTNGWVEVAGRMRVGMTCYDSCVVGRRMYVTEGWTWPLVAAPIGEVYDAGKGEWEEMGVGMREGWVGKSVVVGGRVMVVGEEGVGRRVRVYEEERDEWVAVEGAGVPERVGMRFVVCGDGAERIYVVGNGMRVAVGFVEEVGVDGGDEKRRFGVKWEDVEDQGLSGLTPANAMVLFG